MVDIVLFVEHEFQHILDCVDLSEEGAKSFGEFVIIKTEKEGDVRKLVGGRIVAAYCNGACAFKRGIKILSDGERWLKVNEFGTACSKLLSVKI